MERTPNYGSIIAFVSMSFLILSGDFSLISVALPSIERDLAVNPATMSLIVATNTLTYAGFMILGGRLADRYGQQRCCLAGLALFAVGAVLTALAPAVPLLLAGRALQGLGAAILSPASFSLLNTALPDGPVRRRGYGVFASTQAAALIVGYVIGGGVTTHFGWRVAFLVNLPIIATAMALAARSVPRTPLDPRQGRPDLVGAVLVTSGTSLLVWSVSRMGAVGWHSMEATGAFGAAISIFVAFFLLEARLASPLVPLALFRSRNLISNNLATMCCMAGAAGVFLLPNLYMQRVLGYSAADSGLGMLPQAVGGIVMGRFLVFALGRFPLRLNILGGLGALAGGLILFAALSAVLPEPGYLGNILVPLLLCAFTALFSAMLLMAGGTRTVPLHQQGIASALAMTAQQMGLALGITTILTVTGQTEAAGASVVASLRYGFEAAAGIIVLGALCILLLTRSYEEPMAG